MKKARAKQIVKKLQEEGHNARLDENYSGRGMYGLTTCSVDVDMHPSTFHKRFKGLRSDSMGMDYVYY